MATVAMLCAACQTDDIVDDTLGGAAQVERQIVISGTSAEVTRGYVSDDENAFAYVWDNTQQFALVIEDTTFDAEGGTADYSPMTITPAAEGASATLATTLPLTSATVEAGKSIVSVGPLADDSFVNGAFTATLPSTFATGSAIPTGYLYVQGATTTGDAAVSYDELSLAINHTLVPALVKFELSTSEITSVVLTASSEIFPTTAVLDGTNVATSSAVASISVTNDADAEALYALLFPTALESETIAVTAYIGDTEYEIGTLSANATGFGASFESSQAYVIPVEVTVEGDGDADDANLLVNGSFETGTTENWAKKSGTSFAVTDVAIAGDYSAAALCTSSEVTYTRFAQQVTGLTIGETYYFGVKSRSCDDTITAVGVATEDPTTGTQLSIRFNEGNTTDAPAVTYDEKSSPANAKTDKIRVVYGSLVANKESFWVTDITINAAGINGYGIYDDFYFGTEPYPYVPNVSITGSASYPKTDFMIGDDSVMPTIDISNTGDYAVNWSSSATSVATVDILTGELTVVGTGSANITVSCGGVFSQTIAIAVAENPSLIPFVGDYVYADNTFSTAYNTEKAALGEVGVIYSVTVANGAATGYAVGLDNLTLAWGPDLKFGSNDFANTGYTNGIKNMGTVMWYAEEEGVAATPNGGSSAKNGGVYSMSDFPAFSYFNDINVDEGKSVSKAIYWSMYNKPNNYWFFPSYKELTTMLPLCVSDANNGVAESIEAISGDAILTGSTNTYLSSSENAYAVHGAYVDGTTITVSKETTKTTAANVRGVKTYSNLTPVE